MSKNNYFKYAYPSSHYMFLYHLLSLPRSNKDEDPFLSDCSKDLIRYILEMEEDENFVVTEITKETLTVNHDKYIWIGDYDYVPIEKANSEGKDYYFVYIDPSANCFIINNGQYTKCLSGKKLKEICEKCKSKDQDFRQYAQCLDEEKHRLQTTLQTPIGLWNLKDYKRFTSHLIEDSVVDVTRGIKGDGSCYNLNGIHRIVHGFEWYRISDDDIRIMGIGKYISEIHLYTRLNTINIYFGKKSNSKHNKYVQALVNYADYICPMPITFDLSNYKEKFQYAQSIIDRLVVEGRL